MHNRRYCKAHDCPVCGDTDAEWKWGGARMSSTAWGHDFSCCSDACGRTFAERHKELTKTAPGRAALAELWARLQQQSDAILSGEPYPGYAAERQLRALGRLD